MSASLAKKVEILLPVPFDRPFTYSMPADMQLRRGDYVQVSFGKRTLVGIVWEKPTEIDEVVGQEGQGGVTVRAAYTLKPVLKKFDFPSLSKESLQFVEWVAQYYMMPLGLVLKMLIAEPVVFQEKKRARKQNIEQKKEGMPAALSEDQQRCVDFLHARLQAFHPVLLEGATGSGKTEVYLELIKEVYAHGKQAVVLLPEIALSAQWVSRFEERFGERPLLWHSDLTPSQRCETWERIAKGKPGIVVGARSALFLPYQNLGLIVVDEEHDGGYKQESGVFYQARDMAVVRGSFSSCLVVLASATPSLETLVNVEQGRYERCHLDQRYGTAQFPDVALVDRRTEEGRLAPGSQWITSPLYEALQQTVAEGNQALLFLNRRGYAPLLLCQACGARTVCKQCDSWLVYHKNQQKLQCHHCGYTEKPRTVCRECGAEHSFIPCGPGVERVAEEVAQLFPQARVLMMTSDTMTTLKQSQEMIRQIEDKEVDIIVGTQVMAKGHHFPDLTLVGVIDGDLGMVGSDLRLVERTYQLLHQVAGRSGRAAKKGRVLIQSHMANHPVMAALKAQDSSLFLKLEKEGRQLYGMPPYGRLAALILSGKQAAQVEGVAKRMAAAIPGVKGIEVLGPVPAAMTRLRGHYRWRFLIKGPRSLKLQPFLKKWMTTVPVPSMIRLQIDIDPYSFY
jgi:primosomal protein N' (replication factor Y) (superfamily II helicase)